MLAVSPTTIRAVTHLDLSSDDVDQACEIIRSTGAAKSQPVSKVQSAYTG